MKTREMACSIHMSLLIVDFVESYYVELFVMD